MAAKKTASKKANAAAKPTTKAKSRKRIVDDLATDPEIIKLRRMIDRARVPNAVSIYRTENHLLKNITDALFHSPKDAAKQKRIAARITKRDRAIEKRQQQAGPAFWIETDERWQQLLVKIESAHNAELRKTKREPKTLVRREWAFFNAEAGMFDFTKTRPATETPAVQVIRINRGGSWEIDSFLMACVRLHPVLQDTAEVTHSSARGRMMAWLIEAASASKWPGRGADDIARTAQFVLDLLNPVTLVEQAEKETLECAMRTDRFWEIATALFDFGMNSAYWMLHRGGELEKAATKGYQMQKSLDPWSELIDLILLEFHNKHGNFPTPTKIGRILQMNRRTKDNSDSSPMKFLDSRCKNLPPISWSRFRQRVKDRINALKNG